MTAMNIFQRKQSITIISDTAWYYPWGEIQLFESKTRTLDGMTAVIAFRGNFDLFNFVQMVLEMMGSVDAILADEGLALRRLAAEYPNGGFEVIFAGWSSDGPVTKVFQSADESAQWVDLPAVVVVGPAPSDAAQNAVGLQQLETLEELEEVDLAEYGLKLITAQRVSKYRLEPDYPEMHHVGGDAEMFTLTAGGVHEQVLRQWDEDEVGELIKPADVIPGTQGNRHQRRLEAKQGKRRVA